ncbi:hypothetical protein L9F63_014234, partial [Diploptera punctata]
EKKKRHLPLIGEKKKRHLPLTGERKSISRETCPDTEETAKLALKINKTEFSSSNVTYYKSGTPLSPGHAFLWL